MATMKFIRFSLLCLLIFVLSTIKMQYNRTIFFYNFELQNLPSRPIITYANCAKLIQGDKDEQERVINQSAPSSLSFFTNDYYINATKDCSNFIQTRGYINFITSQKEEKFPLAFTILAHKDIRQIETLLRAIYRPQNAYCVHLDNKTSIDDFNALRGIVGCFPNVYMAPRRFDVRWGKFSLLEADITCMREVWKKHSKWKYLINLTGQEFPLKTNWELVQILTAYRGSNNLEGTIRRRNIGRIPTLKTDFELTWIKGSVHITACRGYVEYLLTNPRAIQMLEILRVTDLNRTIISDEQFYATLNYNPTSLKVPGAYSKPEPPVDPEMPFYTRYKNWYGNNCNSKRVVHSICIYGVRDLPGLVSVPHLFANKFYWNFQPATFDCLQEYNWNKTIMEMMKQPTMNISLYENLPHVKDHI